MEPVAIPKTIDDLIHLLLWSADEIVPFMVCMLSGMLIDQFIPALALEAIAVKFYRRFRDNRPDDYTLHYNKALISGTHEPQLVPALRH
jgi:conjugal transfer pilus assembly protein TraL